MTQRLEFSTYGCKTKYTKYIVYTYACILHTSVRDNVGKVGPHFTSMQYVVYVCMYIICSLGFDFDQRRRLRKREIGHASIIYGRTSDGGK